MQVDAREKLPNLIIAGVHKAGTTSLFTYLAKHPMICASHKKEIGFFVPLMLNETMESLEEYANYFRHCDAEAYRMEASPSYFYGKERVACAIQEAMPDCRIIVILRDPTDRLVSFFNRAVSKSTLPEGIDFNEFICRSQAEIESSEHNVYARAVREGIYIDYIRPWQAVFGRRVRIVFFDDLERDAFQLTSGLCTWLGLSVDCFSASDFTVENKTTQYKSRGLHRRVKNFYMQNEEFWRRHHRLKQKLRGIYNHFNADPHKNLQSVDDAARSRLRAFYAPHNASLRAYLESIDYRAFPRWLRASEPLAEIDN